MASNINPFNVDGTYPIAGQDNDSQGFRDNFTNIRNNLSFAKTELEDLQSKVVLKSALTGSTLDNDFAGAPITGAKLTGVSEALVNLGILTGTVTIDYSAGNIHKVETSDSITLDFTNWPTTGTYGRVQVWVVVTDATYTITVPVVTPGVTIGLADIAGANTTNGIITVDEPGNYIFEFTTADGGQNISIFDVTRNSTTFRGSNLYQNSDINPATLIGYNGGLLNALDNIELLEINRVSALGPVNSAAVGNLQLASISNPVTNTGSIGGYTVTAARGNVVTDTTFGSSNAVKSNDFLGFNNAYAFTGNGAGNVFTQTSSINYYATGSNVVYGLGGNIAVYTKRDGGELTKALAIENDQSLQLNGNLVLKNTAPATSSSTGVAGQVAYDGTYFYVCTSTNTWKRVALNLTSW